MTKSDWTLNTLKAYFEAVLEERQRSLELTLKSQQDALTLARSALELRLEKLNELRQEVTQDRGNYVTREQFDDKRNALVDRVASLESNQSNAIGRGIGISTAWVVLLGGLGGVATLVSVVYLIVKLTGH